MMAYKEYTIDPNLEGLAENLSLLLPFEVQNWNGCSVFNILATTSTIYENS